MRGEKQSRGEEWQSRGRGGARERTYDRGRGHYRGRGRECRPVASNFELVRPGSGCGFGQEVGVVSYHKNVFQYS